MPFLGTVNERHPMKTLAKKTRRPTRPTLLNGTVPPRHVANDAPAARVSDTKRNRATDRGCEETQPSLRTARCNDDPCGVPSWIACCRALLAHMGSDRLCARHDARATGEERHRVRATD